MWNKIINWFFPDWKVVDVIQGIWLTVDGNNVYSHVTHEILYSKRLTQYKLKSHGTDYKDHPTYKEAIQKLNQLEHELNTRTTSNS